MKPLFTKKQYKQAKSQDKLPCECYNCKQTFYKVRGQIDLVYRNINPNYAKFCSRLCRYEYMLKTNFQLQGDNMVINGKNSYSFSELLCTQCGKKFNRANKEIKGNRKHNIKSNNVFCSKSCSITYSNTHKQYGTRRSKLEVWFEEKLTKTYPNIHIDFNKKDAINSELDIYIPSLSLAVELNGIFHYEPIFGKDKLEQTQSNDNRKFQACLEKNIELVIMDVSRVKYFKPEIAEEYLLIIINIINSKIRGSG